MSALDACTAVAALRLAEPSVIISPLASGGSFAVIQPTPRLSVLSSLWWNGRESTIVVTLF